MSTLKDRNVIDLVTQEGDKLALIILDDMQWNYAVRQHHCQMLQDKINDYIAFIENGQAGEMYPATEPYIKVMAQYSYSKYAMEYLERVKKFLNEKGVCDIEWTHDLEDGSFEDGFSDDFVFDINKVYPRVRKNWAKEPLKEVMILPPAYPEHSDVDFSQMPMFRIFDSFVYYFMQDMGNAFTYITYDEIPENITMDDLADKAFENLSKNIEYRMVESKITGIYGLVAGGDFEAESICMQGVWEDIASEFDDDVIIAIPTKDLVFFTKAGDKKLVKKMLKLASDNFETNRRETPGLLFCKDIFIYTKSDGKMEVSNKIKLRVQEEI